MTVLKTLAVSAALLSAATPTLAGGLSPAAVEPVQVTPAPAPRSSWGMILPLVLLAGLVALAVSQDDDEPTPTPAPVDPDDA